VSFNLAADAAVGVAAFWALLVWEAKRGNAAGCALNVWNAGIVAASSGVLIGRLTRMLADGIDPLTAPAQIINIAGGVSTVGSGIGTVVVFTFLARHAPVRAGDAIAPAALFGLAGWHASFFTTTTFLRPELLRDTDVDLYTTGGLLIAGAALAVWKQRGRPPLGAITGTALLASSSILLVAELLHTSPAGGSLMLYSLGMVAGTATIISSPIRRPKAHPHSDHPRE